MNINVSANNLSASQRVTLKHPDEKAQSLEIISDGKIEPQIFDNFQHDKNAISGIDQPKLQKFMRAINKAEFSDYDTDQADNEMTMEAIVSKTLGRGWDVDHLATFRGEIDEVGISLKSDGWQSQSLEVDDRSFTLNASAFDETGFEYAQQVSGRYEMHGGRILMSDVVEGGSIHSPQSEE
jgi:hypothetical protein